MRTNSANCCERRTKGRTLSLTGAMFQSPGSATPNPFPCAATLLFFSAFFGIVRHSEKVRVTHTLKILSDLLLLPEKTMLPGHLKARRGIQRKGVQLPFFAQPTEDQTSKFLQQALRSKASRWQLRNAIRVLCRTRLKGRQAKFKFMVIGKTGEGKSTLINSLVGQNVRRTSQVKSCTDRLGLVQPIRVNGVEVSIYDTQGVQDGVVSDETVFKSIRGKSIHLMVVCVSLNGRAELKDCQTTIATITRELGIQIWERAVVALTQANRVATALQVEQKYGIHRESYRDIVAEFQRVIRSYIRTSPDMDSRYVSAETLGHVPFLTTGLYVDGYESLRELPDTPDWISRFWLGCLHRCTRDTKHAFLLMKGQNLRVQYVQPDHKPIDLPDAVADMYVSEPRTDPGSLGNPLLAATHPGIRTAAADVYASELQKDPGSLGNPLLAATRPNIHTAAADVYAGELQKDPGSLGNPLLAATRPSIHTEVADVYASEPQKDPGSLGNPLLAATHPGIHTSLAPVKEVDSIAMLKRKLSFDDQFRSPMNSGGPSATAVAAGYAHNKHDDPFVFLDSKLVGDVASVIPLEEAAVQNRAELSKVLLELSKACETGSPAQKFLFDLARTLCCSSGAPDKEVEAAAKALVRSIRRLKLKF
ncbi:uncharacterized protein LOC135808788 [Sycon ciliatum]|uniref:uncharacterized protein LOC135808788 n=1 Tax=Sycon ciliatum TaxID=27933 RepID=UPI0031F70C46